MSTIASFLLCKYEFELMFVYDFTLVALNINIMGVNLPRCLSEIKRSVTVITYLSFLVWPFLYQDIGKV